MSLTRDAIDKLQESATAPVFLEAAARHETQVPTVVLPDNMGIHDIERFMPNAARYRNKYVTSHVGDFLAYNKDCVAEGSTCFIDPEQMSAVSIFDIGTLDKPGHKEHRATLEMKKTAPFLALLQNNQSTLAQKKAGEFLEDWADFIQVQTKDGDSLEVNKAVKNIQDLTIETAREVNSKVSDFGHNMSAMERIEAKNQAAIPAIIKFTCAPYLNFEERVFFLRVSVLTGHDKPMVSFRIMQLELHQEGIAEEFKRLIVEGSKEFDLNTYIGKVA